MQGLVVAMHLTLRGLSTLFNATFMYGTCARAINDLVGPGACNLHLIDELRMSCIFNKYDPSARCRSLNFKDRRRRVVA